MNPSGDKQSGINYTMIHDEAVALLPHAANKEQFLVHLKSAMQRVALDAARSSCADIVERVRALVETLDSEPSEVNEPAASCQIGRFQVADELRAILAVPESEQINAAGQVPGQATGKQRESENAPPAPAAPLSASAEPVAWRREWEGDDSDLGNMLYVESAEERDEPVERWEPLYASPRSSSAATITDEWREQWAIFSEDYQRYVDGHPQMPFSLLRVSLSAFMEETNRMLTRSATEGSKP